MRKRLEAVVCPHCRRRTAPLAHQVQQRYVDGALIPVRRLKCRRCGKTFRVLPEWAIPYKHYGASRVEETIDRLRTGGSVREAAPGVGMGQVPEAAFEDELISAMGPA